MYYRYAIVTLQRSIRKYFHDQRRTGRTDSLILEAREEDVVICSNMAEVKNIERKAVALDVEITVVVATSVEEIHRNTKGMEAAKIILDHSWQERHITQALDKAIAEIDELQKQWR
jgi:hypothetical protein